MSQKEELIRRFSGAMCGLAVGDAWGWQTSRLTPHEVSERQQYIEQQKHSEGHLHSGVTTWMLCVLEELICGGPGKTLQANLVARLRALNGAGRGRALRGAPQSLGTTLRHVAQELDKEPAPSFCGTDTVTAEIVPAMLPFGFALGDAPDDVGRGLLQAILTTHRNPQTVAAAAYFVGGVRSLCRSLVLKPDLRDEPVPMQNILNEALAFQENTFRIWKSHKSDLPGSMSQAEGAVQLIHLQALQAEHYLFLAPPDGLDGRDDPVRLAATALLAALLPSSEVAEAFKHLSQRGGDSEILFPMIGAVVGARLTVNGLPLGWLNALATRARLEKRFGSLFQTPPLYVDDLATCELIWSANHGSPNDWASPSKEADQLQQMNFFMDESTGLP